MSGHTQRLNVAPTITMMGVVKTRLSGATKGHQLLKKRSDALTMQFRQILKRIVETKDSMGDLMKASMFTMIEAKYAGGNNIKNVVLENVGKAVIKVRASQDNIAGVKLPKFDPFLEKNELRSDLTGLARGGQQIQLCKSAFMKLVEVLVELASLQTSFLILDEAIKRTTCRMNALENVVKPKLENTMSYIRIELDELEREEFYRLKKVQAYKRKEVDKALEKNKKLLEAQITEMPQPHSRKINENENLASQPQTIGLVESSMSTNAIEYVSTSMNPRSSMQNPYVSNSQNYSNYILSSPSHTSLSSTSPPIFALTKPLSMSISNTSASHISIATTHPPICAPTINPSQSVPTISTFATIMPSHASIINNSFHTSPIDRTSKFVTNCNLCTSLKDSNLRTSITDRVTPTFIRDNTSYTYLTHKTPTFSTNSTSIFVDNSIPPICIEDNIPLISIENKNPPIFIEDNTSSMSIEDNASPISLEDRIPLISIEDNASFISIDHNTSLASLENSNPSTSLEGSNPSTSLEGSNLSTSLEDSTLTFTKENTSSTCITNGILSTSIPTIPLPTFVCTIIPPLSPPTFVCKPNLSLFISPIPPSKTIPTNSTFTTTAPLCASTTTSPPLVTYESINPTIPTFEPMVYLPKYTTPISTPGYSMSNPTSNCKIHPLQSMPTIPTFKQTTIPPSTSKSTISKPTFVHTTTSACVQEGNLEKPIKIPSFLYSFGPPHTLVHAIPTSTTRDIGPPCSLVTKVPLTSSTTTTTSTPSNPNSTSITTILTPSFDAQIPLTFSIESSSFTSKSLKPISTSTPSNSNSTSISKSLPFTSMTTTPVLTFPSNTNPSSISIATNPSAKSITTSIQTHAISNHNSKSIPINSNFTSIVSAIPSTFALSNPTHSYAPSNTSSSNSTTTSSKPSSTTTLSKPSPSTTPSNLISSTTTTSETSSTIARPTPTSFNSSHRHTEPANPSTKSSILDNFFFLHPILPLLGVHSSPTTPNPIEPESTNPHFYTHTPSNHASNDANTSSAPHNFNYSSLRSNLIEAPHVVNDGWNQDQDQDQDNDPDILF